MTEFITAAGVLFSISIFVAHAFDAYRPRWWVFLWTVPIYRVPIPAPFGWRI